MVLSESMTNGCENTFFFTVGAFNCIAVRDSSYHEKPQGLFPQITPEEFDQLSQENNLYFEEKFEMSSLLVDTGKHLVLMDTGWGTGWTPEEGKIESGRLVDRLHRLGIEFTDIDRVVISHGHPDHINANTNSEGQPLFPNAQYVMCKDEWAFWTSDPGLPAFPEEVRQTMLGSVQKNMLNIRDCFDIVDNEAEIIPGIRCIHAPGHSPGHTAHMVTSGDIQLLCSADAFHHPVQLIRPEWSMVMDFDGKQAVESRRRLLNLASEKNTLTFALHFLYPCLGHIEKNNTAWSWQSY